MPLLIHGFVDDQEPTIECDGYIPIVLRWTHSSRFPPIYWRVGDFEKSLVEIGVNEQTGAICKVTVTSLDSITDSFPGSKDKVAESLKGLPCCDLKLWSGETRRIDEKSIVCAYYDNNTFLLKIEECLSSVNRPCVVEYCTGNVRFRLNQENSLCELEVQNLSKMEIENLVSSI